MTTKHGRPRCRAIRYPFSTAEELVALAQQYSISIGEVLARNEPALRPQVRAGLLKIWAVIQECVTNGLHTRGILPGGLQSSAAPVC
jgi:L-serine dehydratase